MEFFIEVVLESLFGLFKSKPEKRPELELKNEFTVKYNAVASIVVETLLFFAGIIFLVFSFFVDGDTAVLFCIFASLFWIVFLLYLFLFSMSCYVTSEKIQKTTLFFFKKEILWDAVICLRVIEKDDESSVTIALYNKQKTCFLDISTGMENAWYLVKMAEGKGIEIRKEKNLSIKQIRKL